MRKALIIMLAVLTMFSSILPVSAEINSDSPAVSMPEMGTNPVEAQVSAPDIPKANSSITVPLTFDGSQPDSSQIKVENVDDSAASDGSIMRSQSGPAAVDDGLPKKVETTMTSTDTTNPSITLVTADKYFLYTNQQTQTTQKQFYAEFEDNGTGLLDNSDCYAKLSLSEDDIAGASITSERTIDIRRLNNNMRNIYCLYSSDISNIITTTPSTVYLSVWKRGSGENSDTKLYNTTAVTINYVESNVARVEEPYNTISYDSDNFYIHLNIYDYIDALANNNGQTAVDLSLVDSNGKVVAKNIESQSNGYGSSSNSTDYRYSSCFNYNDQLRANKCYVWETLYRAADIVPGYYNLKLSINGGTETTYQNTVLAVNDPFLLSINEDGGLTPAAIGGNEVYITVRMINAQKDDFTISIIDETNSVIGSSAESKYTTDQNCFLYKVKLDSNYTFQEGKQYSIKLNYTKPGNIYFIGKKNTQLNPLNGFTIYEYSFTGTVANFNFKAVNAPTNTTLELGLFNSMNQLIGTASVIASNNMSNVQFKDANGNIVSLSPNNNYYIKKKDIDSNGQDDWNNILSFYFYANNNNYIPRLKMESKPFAYTNDTSYNFNIILNKDENKINDTSTFRVNLKNSNGSIIASTTNDKITTENTSLPYWDSEKKTTTTVSAVSISGIIALTSGGSLTEGRYSLDVDMINDTNSSSQSMSFSILSPDKVYATSCHPGIVSTGTGYKISGYMYMIKKDEAYDTNKFTYELRDLLGNTINLGAVAVTHPGYNFLYEDYYEIDIPVSQSIPRANYLRKLKYDGKELYSLYDPTSLIFSSRFNETETISAKINYTWNSNYDQACEGIRLRGNTSDNAIITAVLYDCNQIENFTPVKTVTLEKDTELNRYIFTDSNLSDVDTSKEYDIVFLYNGISLGGLNKLKVASANVQTINVTGVTLDQATLNMSIAETKTLTATVAPSNASNKNVTWSSNNTAVATVDSHGVVTAVSAGNATITATTSDGGYTASCTVTVKPNIATMGVTQLTYNDNLQITAVNGVYNINGVKYPLDQNLPLKLSIKGTHYDAQKSYNYSVSLNNSTVNITGTALGSELTSGKTIELVRPSNLSDGTYTCSIVVKDGSQQVAATSVTFVISGTPIHVTGLTLSRQSLSLTAGATAALTAIVSPSNATNKKVTWSSANTSVAAINASTGAITAIGAGTTSITAITEDGNKRATCIVKVSINMTGTVMYGNPLSRYIWIALYKGGNFVDSTYTDGTGKYRFNNLMDGDYTLKAYSPDFSYKDLNYAFNIPTGSPNTVLNDVSFESKYANRATLTVNVKNAGTSGAFDKEFTAYIYNYETGYYKTLSLNASTPGIVTFDNLPYMDGGTNYGISLNTGADSDYYHDYKTVNISQGAVSVEFNVPVTYNIKGEVKGTDGSKISNTSVKATKSGDGNTYWGFTDDNGAYIIHGLDNGTYTLSVDQKYKVSTPPSITINNANVTTGADITVQKGLTVIGKVLKNGVAAYKAYVVLYDSNDNWVTGGYSTGNDGFVLDGAILDPGTYTLKVQSLYNHNSTWQNFVAVPETINITAENIAAGRLSKDVTYQDPTNASAIFTGDGNMVISSVGLARSGSTIDLIIKYKNNGNTAASPSFTVELPTGVTCTNGNTTFSETNMAPGTTSKQSISLLIGNNLANTNSITIPVKVSIGGTDYDFGSASVEIANITLNGPEAIKSTDSFKVYGEATASSTITIKNAITGEVLGTTTPNGRWYSVEIKALAEGSYSIVAEATNASVTAISQVLKVESKADQITLDKVITSSSNSTDLPINKLIGVRAFTAWVDPYLNGRDISVKSKFLNDSSITSVVYHFSDKDYNASKSEGMWEANITGWSGAGLKTLTATVKTSDNRTLEFIIAEVTVLVDPSGYISDKETKARLPGVTVICEVLNSGNWETWNAELYGQVNPQITDSNGNYGWMVPAGTYRVKALKNGYDAYSTIDDPAFNNGGTSTIVIPPVRTDVNFELTPTVLVTDLSLNVTTAALTVDGTQALTATVTPDNATNASNVTWSTSNAAIATVSNGIVTAKGTGTTTIIAKIGSHTATCTVTVSAKSVTPDDTTKTPTTGTPGGSAGGGAPFVPGTNQTTANDASTTANTTPSVNADASGKAEIKAAQLDKAESLTIKGNANITFDKAAVAAIKALAGDVTVIAKKSDAALSADAKAVIGDRPVYEFNVTVGNKAVTEFKDASIKVEIPYEVKAGEDINAIVIYYIDANGKLNLVNACSYDAATKSITFKTNHFSKYAVGYNKIQFKDVTGWAAEYITYLSSHGIINGVGNNNYAPNSNITRADFAVMLSKIAGADLSKYTASRFNDVKITDRYAKAIEWAADNGVVGGVGNGKFNPNAPITREDMALMISRLAKALNYKLPEKTSQISFADENLIRSYSVDAAKALQRAGIIGGKTKSNSTKYYFAPKDFSTRAEVAKMLTVFMKDMIK